MRKHISEPWFSLIKLGIKTKEGRLNKGTFQNIKIGDIITFENDDFKYKRTIIVEITNITIYTTFREYLKKEQLSECLPSVDTIEEGIKVYNIFYSKEEEERYGILCLKFKIK